MEAQNSCSRLVLLFLSDFIMSSIIPPSEQQAMEQAECGEMAHKDRGNQSLPAGHLKTHLFSFNSLLCFLSTSLIMSFTPLPALENQ